MDVFAVSPQVNYTDLIYDEQSGRFINRLPSKGAQNTSLESAVNQQSPKKGEAKQKLIYSLVPHPVTAGMA
jgi:hypothetical protein